MNLSVVIIHPDRVERARLKQVLFSDQKSGICEFDNESLARSSLERETRGIHAVFVPWRTIRDNPVLCTTLREVSCLKEALIFVLSGSSDYSWLQPLCCDQELLSVVFAKPFRPQAFGRKLLSSLRIDVREQSGVLLVEDEVGVREVMRDYLKSLGFTAVFETNDGREALEILEAHLSEIHLVVSDWEMPRMNGLQLLQTVRGTPKMSRLPFIMVTAQTPLEPLKTIQAAQAVVSGYILKPFNLYSFRSQMDAVLSDIRRQRGVTSFHLQAMVYLAQGNVHRAVEILSDGLKQFVESAELFEALGDAHCWIAAPRGSKAVNLTLAATCYDQALKSGQPSPALVMKCFDTYCQLGKTNDAVRILKAHLAHTGFDDGLRTQLGRIFIQSGDHQAAVAELRQALMINPSNTEAQSLFQTALAQAQDTPLKKAG